MRGQSLEVRFWSKVKRTDGCWLWQGTTQSRGYGHINRGEGRGLNILAHRLSWEMNYGPIPDGLAVLHRCDVRRCVRPDHLFLGTIADNQADMAAKGRSNKGKRLVDGHFVFLGK